MENLAQPQPRPGASASAVQSGSQEVSPERPGHVSRASFDLSNVAQSTGFLAESAFSNLRKSLAAQRPLNFTTVPEGKQSPQPDRERELKPVSVTKPTLEDRLRASFAIGEASNATTPDAISHSPSPKPGSTSVLGNIANAPILSPKSTPLPDSPLLISSPPPTLALARVIASPPPLDLSKIGRAHV